MIKLSGISLRYSKIIFENIELLLGKNEVVGLVGGNGTGKSTLFKIIQKEVVPDLGKLEISKGEKIAYLPQDFQFPKEVLVGEIFESLVENHTSEIYKIEIILDTIGANDIDWYLEAEKLSYGQKMKVYLTKLLIQNPTMLLMDEPTNHLDLDAILWLERFIQNFKGSVFVISHDRTFLNNITNRIVEIDEHKLNSFSGNYDDYILAKQKWVEDRERSLFLQEKKVEKFEKMISNIKLEKASEALGRRLRAVKSRMEREVNQTKVTKYKEKKIKDLVIEGKSHRGKTVLKITDLEFGYPNAKKIFDGANLQIYGNDKIWFQAQNGRGKSTLVKLITGELIPNSGDIEFGENIDWTYFSQDQSQLKYEYTVEKYFLENTEVTLQQSYGILAKFLFTNLERNTLIKDLSPGQRARLIFAVFAQGKYELLILDEPTNHLDIKSKEVIESALREYKGALLLISHDRYFVDGLGVSKILQIENKKLVLHTL